jgi:hypothetical protein
LGQTQRPSLVIHSSTRRVRPRKLLPTPIWRLLHPQRRDKTLLGQPQGPSIILFVTLSLDQISLQPLTPLKEKTTLHYTLSSNERNSKHTASIGVQRTVNYSAFAKYLSQRRYSEFPWRRITTCQFPRALRRIMYALGRSRIRLHGQRSKETSRVGPWEPFRRTIWKWRMLKLIDICLMLILFPQSTLAISRDPAQVPIKHHFLNSHLADGPSLLQCLQVAPPVAIPTQSCQKVLMVHTFAYSYGHPFVGMS